MMKTESSFVGKKRDALGDGEKMIRKKCCRRPTKHRSPSTIVQQLYDTCREVFKGPGTVPPPCDVEKMKLVLDKMKAEDFWISKDLPFFNSDNASDGTPRITYATIYQSENFSLCIFFLPQKAVIPLHNHPGMTVFSKLLLGSMHIKAYDWVDPSKSDDLVPSSEPRLARLEVDSNFTASSGTSILYPTAGGNIHSFTALTPCAVLDVMGPPYSKEEDRDCTYYKEFPYSNFSESAKEVKDDCSYGLLKAIDVPKDLKMKPVEYMGPQFVETC
ncbi:hypothetical protein AAC387_Pa01g2862 [Persea americana]|eukprot:TRINITY_DN34040_c0_g1_i1.p1 TRINITY_DN34040_c0_g1~~TRINITY_DN34040_c0_g1_i1.p1  ORF type:complete len:273 (+),score=43.48 TRINITY_DN34040_c0_g1_i1:952-1770(+)